MGEVLHRESRAQGVLGCGSRKRVDPHLVLVPCGPAASMSFRRTVHQLILGRAIGPPLDSACSMSGHLAHLPLGTPRDCGRLAPESAELSVPVSKLHAFPAAGRTMAAGAGPLHIRSTNAGWPPALPQGIPRPPQDQVWVKNSQEQSCGSSGSKSPVIATYFPRALVFPQFPAPPASVPPPLSGRALAAPADPVVSPHPGLPI